MEVFFPKGFLKVLVKQLQTKLQTKNKSTSYEVDHNITNSWFDAKKNYIVQKAKVQDNVLYSFDIIKIKMMDKYQNVFTFIPKCVYIYIYTSI